MGASVVGSDFSKNEGGASATVVSRAGEAGSTESESERDEARRVFAWVGMVEFGLRVDRSGFDPVGAGIVPTIATSEPRVWLRQSQLPVSIVRLRSESRGDLRGF